ncbi:MAG: hypothetical protein OXU29_10295 [Gammaproteobacteria bacterium]|nr:hypothetical protein [Gammaproteobacteria bacterium]
MKTPTVIFAFLTVTLALPTAEAAWEVTSDRDYKTDKTIAVASTTAKVLRKGGGGDQSYTLAIYACTEQVSPKESESSKEPESSELDLDSLLGSQKIEDWALIWPSQGYVNLTGPSGQFYGVTVYDAWWRKDNREASDFGVVAGDSQISLFGLTSVSVSGTARTPEALKRQTLLWSLVASTLTMAMWVPGKLIMGLPYYKGEVVLEFDSTGFAQALEEAQALCEKE